MSRFPAAHLSEAKQNTLSAAERWGTYLAGAGLALAGLRRNDLPGIFMALAGGTLALRGTSFLRDTLRIGNPKRHSRSAVIPAHEGIKVEASIVVDRPVALVYRVWRNMENLPVFMRHLISVRRMGEDKSHWIARGPAGTTVEWDAEIINEVEDEMIAWKSIGAADVVNAGSVHFQPANNGALTRIHVVLKYDPPAGRLGAAIARLFGEEPGQQVHEDLQRFKTLIEAKHFSKEELEVLRRRSQKTFPAAAGANSTVQESSEESFPASDAPSWTPTTGPRGRAH